jgi:hypothetical protein
LQSGYELGSILINPWDYPNIPENEEQCLKTAQVDEFYKAAIAAGGRGNGKPGTRENYPPNY